jgi:hypothetical protein
MFRHKSLVLLWKILAVHVLVLLSILFFYSIQNFFPEELYRSKLKAAYAYGLIDTNAIERAPTGWGSDKATECLSLGMGLKKDLHLGDRLLNYYPSSTTTYNPCEGLVNWIQGNTEQYEFQSYARYWHGHSEIIRWLVLIFGLPIARALLWLTMFTMLFALYFVLKNTLSTISRRSNVISFIIISVYAFFVGLSDLHSSMTHLLSEISILGIALVAYKILRNGSSTRIILSGYGLGGAYVCTSYMINPQSIPTAILVWATIPIMIKTKDAINILKHSIRFISSLVIGYVLVWASKWVMISMLTPYDIWSEVKKQALHRSSHSADSLSEGVSRHFIGFEEYPAFLRAIIANVGALVSKIYDPRYSTMFALGIYMLVLLLATILFVILWKQKSITQGTFQALEARFTLSLLLVWILSIFQVLIWYTFLTQHSFDHATYTYRSLVIPLSVLPLILTAIINTRLSTTKGNSI